MADRRQIDTRSAALLVASLVGHDNVISISRSILELLGGDYPASILLCQSVYWQSIVEQGKGGTSDGYFWKSMKDWNKETALGEYQVREGTKRLKKAGILETTIRKAWSDQARDRVPTVHYRVDMDKLLELLLSFVSEETIPRKINNPSRGKPKIDSGEIDATIYSKTTKTKTTTTPLPPFPPSPFPVATTQADRCGSGDGDVEEYILLAAEDYCRIKNLGPERLAGTIRSIRKRLNLQGGMTEIDQHQLSAFSKRKQEVQGAVHAEIISLPLPDEPPVWRQAREQLRANIHPGTYSLWIEPLVCVSQEGNTLELVGPDMYFCSWVKDNHLNNIHDALQNVGFMGAKVLLRPASLASGESWLTG
ncbi:MAG: hypothetical protein KKE83_11830 [Proteobacteria bacterium]|nr:hypothetical protein [Pseudomonadota bacterium]MBU2620361.1 hypothetical protein [Pseudomonadota bacterium]